MNPVRHRIELALLGLLALLWGSSYLFVKIAVTEIPPLTLIAARVGGAALFLLAVLGVRRQVLPRDRHVWRMLGVQAIFNSIASWTLLAWGQQFVDAGLASVLNSTSPIFVFLFTALLTRHEPVNGIRLAGALLGFTGVLLIVGVDALAGLGEQVAGQLACLAGAALYAGAAIYGKRLAALDPVVTAAGTMLWASAILVPLALFVDHPLLLRPSPRAIAATLVLSLFCTGVALLLYFRLLRSLGSLGVASQSYLRAGVGVMLGVVILGEQIAAPVLAGLLAALAGVILINRPVSSGNGRNTATRTSS